MRVHKTNAKWYGTGSWTTRSAQDISEEQWSSVTHQFLGSKQTAALQVHWNSKLKQNHQSPWNDEVEVPRSQNLWEESLAKR